MFSPRDVAPWLDSQLLHQHSWPRTSICSPDLLACMLTHITHIETHTGYKVICIYLETQAWARQSSLLNIPGSLFSFVEVNSAAGRMTVKTFRGTNELPLWKSDGEIKVCSFNNYFTLISSDSKVCHWQTCTSFHTYEEATGKSKPNLTRQSAHY